MAKSCHFLELDDATRNYLLAARDRGGEGMPGIYLPRSNYWPLAGLLVGIGLIVFILIFTLPPLGDPLKTAMLQMAALLPGIWMIVAAVRVWVSSGSARRAGHFIYADPDYLYECKGTKVLVTPLRGLVGVDVQDNYNEGTYTGSTCYLDIGDKREQITISDGDQTVRFRNFMNTIAAARREGRDIRSGVLGEMARRQASEQYAAEDVYARDDGQPDPPTPQRSGTAPTGLLAMAIIVALTIGGVFLLKVLNVSWRDDAMFKQALTHPIAQEKPVLLRVYLLDPRNTRHRPKAEQMLEEYYQPALSVIEARATDAELKKGMIALVTALGKAKQPLVSVRVTEVPVPGVAGPEFQETQITNRRDAVAKWLATSVTRVVGTHLVEVVELLAEGSAMIDIRYRFVPGPTRADLVRVEWTVEIRERPDATPVRKTLDGQVAWETAQFFFEFHRREAIPLMQALVGEAHAPDGPPPGIPGGPPPF